MRHCHRPFHRFDVRQHLGLVDRVSKRRPQRVVIWRRERTARFNNPTAIGPQQGGVDTIDRSAAHQSERQDRIFRCAHRRQIPLVIPFVGITGL